MHSAKANQKRNLKEPPPVIVQPLSVSDDDRSCFAVTGRTGRQLRDFGDAHNIPYTRAGKRRIYLVADLRCALERLSVAPAESGSLPVDTDDDDVPTSAAGVLAAIGRRAVR